MIRLNIIMFLFKMLQFGIAHLPVGCVMNTRNVVNDGIREDDNNYISGYRIIWNAKKGGKIQTTID